MVKVSTKYNAADAENIKAGQRPVLIAGAVCTLAGIVAGIICALLIHIAFLILLLGSGVIAATVVFYLKSMKSFAAKQKDKAYAVITFDGGTVTVELQDDAVLTPTQPTVYDTQSCTVTSSGSFFYLKVFASAEDKAAYSRRPSEAAPLAFSFNISGFLEGTPDDLKKTLRKTDGTA
ncbi:MAG: hypothetical protein LBT30_04250 [Clostridiales bacterium]|jgi:hypothetical protein|nr:hypothetical protein [Clostridiales bacterium]